MVNSDRLDRVVEYIKTHHNREDEEKFHCDLLDDITINLHRLGFHSSEHIYREIELFAPDNHSVRRVDLIVFDENEMSIIEAKVERKGNHNLRNDINQQLIKSYGFFMKYFQIAPHMVGVYRHKGSSRFEFYKIPRSINDFNFYLL